jgi:hypothetical protein
MVLKLLLIALGLTVGISPSRAEGDTPSTNDFNWLVGTWNVERDYLPNTDQHREMNGTISCDLAVSDAYYRCDYHLSSANRAPAHEVVYLNYNAIYGRYETLWISAGWPIKNTMSAIPGPSTRELVWTSSFLIENGVTESVESQWSVLQDGNLQRRTLIRTSNDEPDTWLHWMTEVIYLSNSEN